MHGIESEGQEIVGADDLFHGARVSVSVCVAHHGCVSPRCLRQLGLVT